MRYVVLTIALGLMTGCGQPPDAAPRGVKSEAEPGNLDVAAVASSPNPAPAPGNSVSAKPGDPTVCVVGWLTQKGSEPGTFWAITDSAGTVWQVLNPEAISAARADRTLQEAPVSAIGRRVPGVPFVGILVLDLRQGKCPEGVVGGY